MSQFWEYIKIAVMNIRSNKGRSVLTMLGIIIGISSVIMIITIGNGLHGTVNGELNSIGGGMISLTIDTKKTDKKPTMEDLDALKSAVPAVKGVTPIGYGMGTASSRKGSISSTMLGGTEAMQFYNSDPIVRGTYFTRKDVDGVSPVCILRESDAKFLFGTTDVIGLTFSQEMYGTTQELRIIGVRKDSTSQLLALSNGGGKQIQPEVPITVMSQIYQIYGDDFTDLYIIADPMNSAEVAKASVRYLESRLGIRGLDAIKVEKFSDVTDKFNTILNYVTMFIALVAAISLLVGGIGVMNIMLVSVTERTREIGIRKSLGARTASILLQFLAEASIITMLGGIIGIVLGLIGGYAVCSALHFPVVISPLVVIATTLFSSGVGIFFGIYPAKKAAGLSPIEALRHD